NPTQRHKARPPPFEPRFCAASRALPANAGSISRTPEILHSLCHEGQELAHDRRRVATARREAERGCWAMSACEATIHHAIQIHALHRGRNEANAPTGGDEV